MAATIKIKNSSTTGAVPTSGDLVQGELAVNVTDTGLYTENASGTVVKLNAPSIDDKNTGATKHLTISTGGNLGLGVTPSVWYSTYKALQLGSAASIVGRSDSSGTEYSSNVYRDAGATYKYIASDYASAYRQYSGIHSWFTAASGTAGNAISFTQAMTLDASGRLGIGVTSPSALLHVYGSSNTVRYEGSSTSLATYQTFYNGAADKVYFGIENSSGGGIIGTGAAYGMVLSTASTNPLVFGTNATERARIDSSGNLLVGTTSSLGTGITVSNAASGTQIGIRNTSATAGNYWNIGGTSDSRLYIINAASTGVYMTYGATSWTGISDERAKDIIEPITNAANKVSTLRAVIGKYKTDSDGIRRSFLIAQDVQAVFPEAVDATNPEMLGVSYTDTIPLLVAAIKEQQAIITQLQADVAALKG